MALDDRKDRTTVSTHPDFKTGGKARCIYADAGGERYLTVGREYTIHEVTSYGDVKIVCDDGQDRWVHARRFELVEPAEPKPIAEGDVAEGEAMAALRDQLLPGDRVKLTDGAGNEAFTTLIHRDARADTPGGTIPHIAHPLWTRIEVVSLAPRRPDWADDSHVIATIAIDSGEKARALLRRHGDGSSWLVYGLFPRAAADLRDVVRLTPEQLAALDAADSKEGDR